MPHPVSTSEALMAAWSRIGKKANARLLFEAAQFAPNQVVQFYEVVRATPELRTAFQHAAPKQRTRRKSPARAKAVPSQSKGHFRLVELWLDDFKNLSDYSIRFDPRQGLDVILGWNGTGKSNLLEALVVIFRDLNDWCDKNRWPEKPLNAFRLSYQIDER